LAPFLGTAAWSAPFALTTVQPQFRVNTYTWDGQHHATVDMDDQGLFLVTWNSHFANWTDIKARAFYADGQPWTKEFLVNRLVIAGSQYSPDVATGGGANWVVVWPNSETGDLTDIYAKIYSSASHQTQIEFVVNPDQDPSVLRCRPDAAMLPNGDFLLIWDHGASGKSLINYFVQMFDPAGNPLTARTQINQTPSDLPPFEATGTPDIVVQEVDGQVTAFASWKKWHTTDGEWAELVGRRFDPYGMVLEDEFGISPADSGVHQGRPMVDMNGQGDILVVWQEFNLADGLYDIHTRKYTAGTDTWGALIDPPGNAEYEQHRAHGLLSESGGMMLGWTRIEPANGSDNVYLMAYDDQGNELLSAPEIVNTTKNGIQRRPALGMVESGGNTHLAVIWESNNNDTSGYAVMGAVYDFDGFPATGSKNSEPWAVKSSRPLVDFGLDAKDLYPRNLAPMEPLKAPQGITGFSSSPNPFNPTTAISFSLDEAAPVTLEIFDLAGHRVRSLAAGQTFSAGSHDLTWHGRDEGGRPSSSGVYFLRLTAGDQSRLQRVTLAR